jgi:Tfp pilus assembly protein PilF
VGNALANNPLSKAFSAMRNRKPAPAAGQHRPNSYEHDPISLQRPVGPPSPDLLIATAQLCERQGQIEQARHHYSRALAIAPTNIDALLGAARMEDRLGKLDVAEQLYRRAVATNPRNTRALNDLALCLARQGQVAESAQLLERAIQIQPEKPLYRNNIATVLVELDRDREALAHLSAVHGPAVANYNLGHLLTKRGRGDEAASYFLAAAEIDPRFGQAQAALAAVGGVRTDRSRLATGDGRSTAPPAMTAPPVTGPQMARPAVNPPHRPASAQRPLPPGYPRQAMRPPTAGMHSVPPPNPHVVPVRHLPPVGAFPNR